MVERRGRGAMVAVGWTVGGRELRRLWGAFMVAAAWGAKGALHGGSAMCIHKLEDSINPV